MNDNIPQDEFIPEVMKTFAQNCDPSIEISIHPPKSHHGLPSHSQFNIIDTDKDVDACVAKFRIFDPQQ